jgi:aminopeptidase-like protein
MFSIIHNISSQENKIKLDYSFDVGAGLVRNIIAPVTLGKFGFKKKDYSFHLTNQTFFIFKQNNTDQFVQSNINYLGLDYFSYLDRSRNNDQIGIMVGYCFYSTSNYILNSALKISLIHKRDIFSISPEIIFTKDTFYGISFLFGFGS